jgi:2-polyprenyl-3-methyl-5-hydroxy-6-metoxy-1,4-benzoquinol methylase
MSKKPVAVVCTICSSSRVREIVLLSGGEQIMFCQNCKNAFTCPKPQLPDYSSEDFQTQNQDTEKLTLLKDLPGEIGKSYAIQLQIIEKNVPKGSAILEIGGGEGIFLEMLKDKGYETELIEPSVSASKRARARGLNVYTGYFQDKEFYRKYALICMSHVLEHIDDPLSVLAKLRMLLLPGGYILLSQSNFEGFMPWFLKSDWYAWVPNQHFTHFSLSGTKYVAAKSSFSISTYKYSRLVHGPSVYHSVLKYIPFLQDQIHILLQVR